MCASIRQADTIRDALTIVPAEVLERVMLRLFKCWAFAIGGALAGAILGIMLGVILGMTYTEFAQHSCAGATCADLIVRSFIPGGALAGGMAGLIAARPRERLNRF